MGYAKKGEKRKKEEERERINKHIPSLKNFKRRRENHMQKKSSSSIHHTLCEKLAMVTGVDRLW
jgi:hypothetical protein